MKANAAVIHTEGESNTSDLRAAWLAHQDDPASRDLLARDADVFLHLSLSTSCIARITAPEASRKRSAVSCILF